MRPPPPIDDEAEEVTEPTASLSTEEPGETPIPSGSIHLGDADTEDSATEELSDEDFVVSDGCIVWDEAAKEEGADLCVNPPRVRPRTDGIGTGLPRPILPPPRPPIVVDLTDTSKDA